MSNCPARAGFTSATNGCAVRTRDHPRSRGVYMNMSILSCAISGSSPLARGLPTRLLLTPARLRIIPARAGFTQSSTRTSPRTPDHPRSRGVYYGEGFLQERLSGSSPLARGLPSPIDDADAVDRIIPARAGFTLNCPSTSTVKGDHPRSRGVYLDWIAAWSFLTGSSPLARGLPLMMS